ncbi:hypothetical protein GCM10007868_02750 [Gluconobacter frateurii]|uniref:Uncharacterized protein n=1 Tax=Gluconobacter frateurii NRIC 0228 TaxID=1307946 RepID=A0ABQ0QB78_9PROT|nr:hypothetical protein AA0228_1469 [Gluconobacter frateurii NRIC 0228]GLP89200.1 hypothetical protein GCM10007868_02750 [Gluconobacter frateurii]
MRDGCSSQHAQIGAESLSELCNPHIINNVGFSLAIKNGIGEEDQRDRYGQDDADTTDQTKRPQQDPILNVQTRSTSATKI